MPQGVRTGCLPLPAPFCTLSTITATCHLQGHQPGQLKPPARLRPQEELQWDPWQTPSMPGKARTRSPGNCREGATPGSGARQAVTLRPGLVPLQLLYAGPPNPPAEHPKPCSLWLPDFPSQPRPMFCHFPAKGPGHLNLRLQFPCL